MEPISLIVTALTAGAVAAAKDTAEKGVKDAYQGLKTLIKRKFTNDALAQAMVEAKPEDIKKAEGLLKDKIVEAGVDKDHEITKLAQDLLTSSKNNPVDNKLSPKILVMSNMLLPLARVMLVLAASPSMAHLRMTETVF